MYIYQTTHKFLIYRNEQKNNIKEPPIRKKKKNSKTMKENNTKKAENRKKRKARSLKTKKNHFDNLNILISINKTPISRDNLVNNSLRSKKTTGKYKKEKTMKNKNSYKRFSNDFTNQKYDLYFDKFFSDSPDEMEFDDAIKLDKRQFCQYFSDNIKNNQIISNTFCLKEIFKPISIKIIFLF